MKYRRLYTLLTGIFVVLTCTQCDKSITQGNDEANLTTGNQNLTLVAPDTDTEQSTFSTLEWEGTKGSGSFQVQLSPEEDFTTIAVDSIVDSASFSIDNLQRNTTYYWKVRSVDKDKKGSWSEIRNFRFKSMPEPVEGASKATIDLDAPEQRSPIDLARITSVKPSFEWDRVEGADSYILHASNGDEMVVQEQVDGTSYSPGEDFPQEAIHEWRVRAVKNGELGKWSEVKNFTTTGTKSELIDLEAPGQMNVNDASSSSSEYSTLEWEPVEGASSYILHVTESDPQVQNIDQMVVKEHVYDDHYTPEMKFSADETYYWKVRAIKDGGLGEWSEIKEFGSSSQDNSLETVSGSIAGDRQALMDLYEAAGGDNWKNNRGWGDGNPSNEWYGIEVDENGRVVKVDLFDNNLNGELPSSVGNLTSVTYLNVKHNSLTGELPASLGNLKSVEWLSLAGPAKDPTVGGSDQYPMKNDWNGNTFTGRIPPELGNLPNVLFIELSRNNFEGGIPQELGNATTLLGLYLNYNGLTGEIPASLGNLTDLIELQLHGGWGRSDAPHTDQPERTLSGELPSELGNLRNLEVLRIGANKITGTIPESFRGLTSLRHIIAQRTSLTGDFPFHIFNSEVMPGLNSLFFPRNAFTGSLPKNGQYSDRVAVFDFYSNNLTGTIPDWIAQLNPIIINLGLNELTGEIPQSGWNDMSRLRYIRLNGNKLRGHIPGAFFDAIDNNDLRWIWLQNNNFTSIDANAKKSISSSSFEYIDDSGNNF